MGLIQNHYSPCHRGSRCTGDCGLRARRADLPFQANRGRPLAVSAAELTVCSAVCWSRDRYGPGGFGPGGEWDVRPHHGALSSDLRRLPDGEEVRAGRNRKNSPRAALSAPPSRRSSTIVDIWRTGIRKPRRADTRRDGARSLCRARVCAVRRLLTLRARLPNVRTARPTVFAPRLMAFGPVKAATMTLPIPSF